MRNKPVRPWLLAFLAAWGLSACVSSERVILLPGQEGRPNAVTVRLKSGGAEYLLNAPYQSAALQNGGFSTGKASAQEVAASFGATLAELPPQPVRFTFYFPEGSSELTPESCEQLPLLRQALMEHPAAEILIVGHTDTVGNLLHNDALSLERAQALRDILEAEGMNDIARMEVAGRGQREPLVSTPDETREPRNRRVVVTVR
ncbi:MAG: OmpA family protein [Zoogloeaceae bacterium]|jgi:outer membrane protein OmpA-like peptidoglycan-associated protein|nr:OmpA family protein [Zoogloeaceae bacterium]